MSARSPDGSAHAASTGPAPGLIDDRLRSLAASVGDRTGLVLDDGVAPMALTWGEIDARTREVAARIMQVTDASPAAAVLVGTVHPDPTTVIALIGALRCPHPVVVYRGVDHADGEPISSLIARAGYTAIDAVTATVRESGAEDGTGGRTVLGPETLVLASGGSSGRARLVVDPATRTAAARSRALRSVCRTGWRAGQRQLVLSPLYHASGISYFAEGLAEGNTTILPTFFRPALISDLVTRWAVEWVQSVPFHLTQIQATAPDPSQWSTVRGLLHLAAACPERTKRFWHELLDPTRVYEVYSASERIGLTLARGDEWEQRPGTVGRGFLTHIRVLDDDLDPVPDGQNGTVFLRAAGRRSRPYLGSGGRLRATPDGFASLGDVGHLDGDGYLYLAPRQIASISVGGVTVLPTEIEQALLEHPSVLDVGVTAIPDPNFGERPLALVVITTERAGGASTGVPPTEKALRAWVRPRLHDAQIPARIAFVAALPRTEAGKLDRRQLADLAGTVCLGR